MDHNKWITEVIDGLPPMLNVEDVCAVMRIGRRHVYRLCSDGRLIGLKTAECQGRGSRAKLLIPRASLEKLLRRMSEGA